MKINPHLNLSPIRKKRVSDSGTALPSISTFLKLQWADDKQKFV